MRVPEHAQRRVVPECIDPELHVSERKEVAKDVNGDIIGLGDQRYVVVTPQAVKISRDKIGGAD